MPKKEKCIIQKKTLGKYNTKEIYNTKKTLGKLSKYKKEIRNLYEGYNKAYSKLVKGKNISMKTDRMLNKYLEYRAITKYLDKCVKYEEIRDSYNKIVDEIFNDVVKDNDLNGDKNSFMKWWDSWYLTNKEEKKENSIREVPKKCNQFLLQQKRTLSKDKDEDKDELDFIEKHFEVEESTGCLYCNSDILNIKHNSELSKALENVDEDMLQSSKSFEKKRKDHSMIINNG